MARNPHNPKPNRRKGGLARARQFTPEFHAAGGRASAMTADEHKEAGRRSAAVRSTEIDPRLLAALIAARTRRGWTQSDLADRLEVSQQTVARWESDRGPRIETVQRWAAALGVAVVISARCLD